MRSVVTTAIKTMNIYERSGMTSIQCTGHITDVTLTVIGIPPLCFHNVGLNQQLDLFIFIILCIQKLAQGRIVKPCLVCLEHT